MAYLHSLVLTYSALKSSHQAFNTTDLPHKKWEINFALSLLYYSNWTIVLQLDPTKHMQIKYRNPNLGDFKRKGWDK